MTPVVLLVDDNTFFRRIARAILEHDDPRLRVHALGSGAEALAFLEHRPPFGDAPRPAFVVLDFHLDDLDAPAVLQRLRTNQELRDLPVLVLSVSHWPEDEAAAMAAGATGYCVKPSLVDPLRDAILNFWREHADGTDDPGDRG